MQQQPIELRFLTDKTVTMYCLYKGKGSITIGPLVDNILELAEQNSWKIDASHISGFSNIILDGLSKFSRSKDYAIKREVLQKSIMELWTQISINVFVTRANRQCTRYCSISEDKLTVRRNGFNLELSKKIPLLHPQIFQIPKTVLKIKKE
ncbi:MAG: hypothetical protein EZS28_006636 [Streblomastix strix]|uniref:Uncharacterized protein n=1 Tax=Streblomastix strix TaxID=222440 RepID=A0A5J4WUJ6_9EUKA|nr:MAG: hypothetical protein EZS28_006636 [Streblomastix strix]